jgi:hypothetical protein
LLAIRSREGRAWVPLMLAAFFVMLVATAMAGERGVIAGSSKAGGAKRHAGKPRRPTGKKHARCVTAKSKQAHKKSERVHGSHGKSHQRAHPNKPKKCPPSRRLTKKSLIPIVPFAPPSPVGIAPTLTPPPGPIVPPAVTAPAKPSPSTSCFAAPGVCGYPDPNYGNAGATSACSSLASSGSVSASTAGQTIQNLDITGSLSINAANVTVNNVCITENGGMTGDGIDIASGATNALVEHTTIQSSSPSSPNTFMDTGVAASIGSCTSGIVLNYDVIEGAAESVHAPYNCKSTATGLTLENSYLQAGYFFTRSGAPSHNEDVYLSDSSFTAIHDTLLNAQGQTAVLFGDNNGGTCCIAANNHWIVKDSLLAGGGYMAYWNAKSNSVGSSTMDVENNNWARCTTKPAVAGDGEECNKIDPGASGGVPFGQSAGADSHGYFPNGGYYPEGLESGGDLAYGFCPPTAGQTFTGNVWDDNGAPVGC